MRRKGLFAGIVAAWLAVLFPAFQVALAQDRPYLGVTYQDLNADEAAALGWPTPRGIKLAKVLEGSAADKAGLRAGDIILTLDRVEVRGLVSRTSGTVTVYVRRLEAFMDLKSPGDTVEIAIFRDGREHKLAVTPGSRPPSTPEASQPAPACKGKDLLAEIARTDPAGHARIMAAAAATPNAKGLLWRVEKPGVSPSYLLGTIHLTDDRVNDLPPAVKEALAGAKRLAVEVADLSPAGVSQAMQQIGTLGQYGGGQSIKTELPPSEYAALQDMLAKRGLPRGATDGMRPWMMSLSLAVPDCERARQAHGLKPLDIRLAEDAKARGIAVVGLETAELQLRTMASLSTFSQLALLVSYVRYGDRVEDGVETVVQGYLKRNVSFIWPLQLYLHEKAGLPKSALDEYDAAMLVRRNHGMRDAALPLLAEGGLFIAVGAGHLSGSEGMVELLRQAGYAVTAIE